MKLKDIKVGEDYAVGTNASNRRRTVTEVGIFGSVMAEGAFRSHTSHRADYVAFVDRDYSVSCREVLRPWAEQEPINAKQQAAEEERYSTRIRVRRLQAAAPALLAACRYMLTKNLSTEELEIVKAAVLKAEEA